MRRRIALVAVALGLAIAGCGSDDTGTVDTSPGAYPAGLQGSLVGACTGDGASTAECECELKLLEATEDASDVTDALSTGMQMGDDAQQLAKKDPGAFRGGCPS